MPTGICPECDADVHVDTDTDKGESVSCEECGTELEVVGLDPVELDIVEEEDLDDDACLSSGVCIHGTGATVLPPRQRGPAAAREGDHAALQGLRCV